MAAGKPLLDPVATQRVLDRLRKGQEPDGRLDGLSDQERRILDLIGETMHLAEKTVKHYVSRLLAKLGMAHSGSGPVCPNVGRAGASC